MVSLNGVATDEFSGCVSFPERLTKVVDAVSEKTALRFLSFGGNDQAQSYQALMAQIHSAAANIRLYCRAGDRAVILLPTGVEFVSWFVGCFFVGVVATPTAVPVQRREWERLVNILRDSEPSLVITDGETIEKLKTAGILSTLQRASIQVIDVHTVAPMILTEPPRITPDMMAFLQYTSGSTGNPKGVMVSHGNLMHNEAILRQALLSEKSSVLVSWLPLFHDMGLIGQMLLALHSGATLCLMSPESFLRDPLRWLETISRFRGTISGAPNFAYELCIKKAIAAPERIANLDLSHWKRAFNGAEPVRGDTLRRFAEVFSPCGFKTESLYPCYGLAEGTLIVSGAMQTEGPRFAKLNSDQLQHRRVSLTTTDDAKEMVASGVALGDQLICIVDPDTTRVCDANEIGEIWVQGGSIGKGYWNNPEASAECFSAYTREGEGPFLRTGDLGFLLDGYLYISSRCKDLIIINGKNFYPQDLERSAETGHEGLRPGCSAAFSMEHNGQEQLVLLCEIDPKKVAESDLSVVMAAARAAVFEQQHVSIAYIGIFPPQTLFKTSSGKIQRRSCSAAFRENALRPLAEWTAPLAHETIKKHVENAPLNQSNRALIEAPVNAVRVVPSRAAIKTWIRQYLVNTQGFAPQDVKDSVPFSDFGFDSAQAVELCSAVSEWLGVEVPTTHLWDCPNIDELSRALHEQNKIQDRNEKLASVSTEWANSVAESGFKKATPVELAG